MTCRCGRPGSEIHVVKDEGIVCAGNACNACFDALMAEFDEARARFDAMIAAGVDRDTANAVMMAKGARRVRICITGGPRTGKTTLAGKLFAEHMARWDGSDADRPHARHTDSLIGTHDWSEASAEVASWLDAPGPWIIEGVAVSRALRKWRVAHPGEPPPVDRVIMLTEPYESLSRGQAAMAKGVTSVHEEIKEWLRQHGVES